MRMDNNLLPRASILDEPGDRVGPLPATPCGRRYFGELDDWPGAAFLGMASLTCKVETQSA
jgi:hypothetical protein